MKVWDACDKVHCVNIKNKIRMNEWVVFFVIKYLNIKIIF